MQEDHGSREDKPNLSEHALCTKGDHEVQRTCPSVLKREQCGYLSTCGFCHDLGVRLVMHRFALIHERGEDDEDVVELFLRRLLTWGHVKEDAFGDFYRGRLGKMNSDDRVG